jgi:hypothetical protein
MYYNLINPCSCGSTHVVLNKVVGVLFLYCEECSSISDADVRDPTLHDLARAWNLDNPLREEVMPSSKWATMQAYKEDMLSTGDIVKVNHA